MYGNMNQSMSEADLRRLAEILQERGEGLAAINQGEAQLLQALGGSGQALPGTQGMGVAGGPIRSYFDPSADPATQSDKGDTNTGTNQNQSTSDNNQSGGGDPALDPSYDPETEENLNVDRGGDTTPSTPDTTPSDDGDSTPTVTAPAPTFTDKLGNTHNSQAEADAANEKITKQQIALR